MIERDTAAAQPPGFMSKRGIGINRHPPFKTVLQYLTRWNARVTKVVFAA